MATSARLWVYQGRPIGLQSLGRHQACGAQATPEKKCLTRLVQTWANWFSRALDHRAKKRLGALKGDEMIKREIEFETKLRGLLTE